LGLAAAAGTGVAMVHDVCQTVIFRYLRTGLDTGLLDQKTQQTEYYKNQPTKSRHSFKVFMIIEYPIFPGSNRASGGITSEESIRNGKMSRP
jgi:hypothetical protein